MVTIIDHDGDIFILIINPIIIIIIAIIIIIITIIITQGRTVQRRLRQRVHNQDGRALQLEVSV